MLYFYLIKCLNKTFLFLQRTVVNVIDKTEKVEARRAKADAILHRLLPKNIALQLKSNKVVRYYTIRVKYLFNSQKC